VVDYWATWCGPCKLISPHFAKMEEKYPKLKFAKVDVEEQEVRCVVSPLVGIGSDVYLPVCRRLQRSNRSRRCRPLSCIKMERRSTRLLGRFLQSLR